MSRVDELTSLLVEVEAHAAEQGWDAAPRLFAIADTESLRAAEPQLVDALAGAGPLTPVEQDPLDDGPLDEVLAGLVWGDDVIGCVLVQEVLMVDSADPPEGEDAIAWAAAHEDKREIRLVVGVLREGTKACALRARGGVEGGDGELLVGEDLVPLLSHALLQTFTP